jgi:estrone sulfotransferase
LTPTTQGTVLRDALRRSRLLRAAVVANRHRGLRADDLFVASYPRSGNTWVRFVLAELANGAPADFESIDRMIPAIGSHRGAVGLVSGRRLIKTHEPYRAQYARAVYLVRDVRDVLISWYRVTRSDPDDVSALDSFVAEFITEQASPYGRWTDHVRSWQRARERGKPVLICRFEDVQADPPMAFMQIASFLGLAADAERVGVALARNTPEEMRRLEQLGADYLRRTVGHRSQGVRRGSVGSWRELLSDRHLRVLEPALQLNTELGYGG